MFIHLLATLAMGALGAVAVWTIARTIGWKKPGFAYPVAIALGMLSYTIYDEYSWYSRVSTALPTRLDVVRTYATSLPYQPWTYAVPRIYKFDAVDLASPRANPSAPELLLVLVKRITRNTSTVDVSVVVDCEKARYHEITRKTEFNAQGLPENADWSSLSQHKALRDSVCTGAAVPSAG